MKIDLHVHAKERSGCSKASEKDLIEAAQVRGLDALAFTDHGRLVPWARLEELNQTYSPFRVFSGIEVHTEEGEDALVYGVRDPALEGMGWRFCELVEFVRQRGGCTILAHPFRYRPFVAEAIYSCKPDAVELCSVNIATGLETEIRKLAEVLGCPTVAASDAHSVENVGSFFIETQRVICSDEELVDLLRTGSFTLCGPPRGLMFT